MRATSRQTNRRDIAYTCTAFAYNAVRVKNDDTVNHSSSQSIAKIQGVTAVINYCTRNLIDTP